MSPAESAPCPVCGAANPPGARACSTCGVPLSKGATEAQVDDLLKDLLEPGAPPPASTADSLNLDAEIVDELLDSIFVEPTAPVIKVECPLCGHEVSSEASRCDQCGAEFEEVSLPAAAPSVPDAAPPAPATRPPGESEKRKRRAESKAPPVEERIPISARPTETPHRDLFSVSGRTVDLVVLGTVAGLVAVFLAFRMYSWSTLSGDSMPLLVFLGVAAGGLAAGLVLFRLSTSALAQGDRLVKEGRYAEALAHYDRAIRMGYRPSNAWTSRGVAMKRLDRLDEALRCQRMAVKIDPENEIAWCNMGDAYFRMEDFAQALESYDRAIKIRPKYAIAWNNKGAALARTHRFEEARDCHDRAVQFQPRYVAAWLNRGEVLARLGDREGAQKCLERARALGA